MHLPTRIARNASNGPITGSAPPARSAPSTSRVASRLDDSAPRLVSVATALPPHRVEQGNAKTLATALFSDAFGESGHRLLEVFDHCGVESRQICMPLEWYEREHTFEETSELYVARGVELASEAAAKALARSGLTPADVDHVVFVSSTGIAAPSLDARLANLLGFREGVRRTPIWGLGCAGGAAGLSHARDFARANPEGRVLLV